MSKAKGSSTSRKAPMFDIIVDIHTHLLGITEQQLLQEMERAGVDYAVSATVEVSVSDLRARPEILTLLKQRFRQSSLQHRALAGIWNFSQVEVFFNELASTKLLPTNWELADLVRKYPQRIIGFGSLDPNGDGDYVERKLEEISRLGLKGIKLLPTFQVFNPSRNDNFEKIVFGMIL